MHSAKIVHRDLKLENIMVELSANDQGHTSMICKVTDFGFATVTETNPSLQLKLGTPLFMAPEVIEGSGYSHKVDVWALGVITYAVLTSQYPFNGVSKDQIYALIRDPNSGPNYAHLDKYWQNGAMVKDFLKKCLNKNPN